MYMHKAKVVRNIEIVLCFHCFPDENTSARGGDYYSSDRIQ